MILVSIIFSGLRGASKCLQEAPDLPRLHLAFWPGSKLTRRKKHLFVDGWPIQQFWRGLELIRNFGDMPLVNRDTLCPKRPGLMNPQFKSTLQSHCNVTCFPYLGIWVRIMKLRVRIVVVAVVKVIILQNTHYYYFYYYHPYPALHNPNPSPQVCL